jgi:predicted nucleic acid-binding protein
MKKRAKRSVGWSGVKVHDTRLVSLMMVRGITRIITFNVQDFQRFDGIEAIHPDNVR